MATTNTTGLPPRLITADEKKTKSVMVKVRVTKAITDMWLVPDFQREFICNSQVRDACTEIAATAVIPGVLLIGELDGKLYRVDGNHRTTGFTLAVDAGRITSALADVRFVYFDTMEQMALTFVKANTFFRRMMPNNLLRAMIEVLPGLQLIRQQCPFVGTSKEYLSMASVLRCWSGASGNAPSTVSADTYNNIIQNLTIIEATPITRLLIAIDRAGWNGPEYKVLKGQLNLAMTMWLFRRMVLGEGQDPAVTRLTDEQFTMALMQVSTDGAYLNWLVNRKLAEAHRSHAYTKHLMPAFKARLNAERSRWRKSAAPIPKTIHFPELPE